MKNWKKRFTSLFLAIVMCLSLGVPALAAEIETAHDAALLCDVETEDLLITYEEAEYIAQFFLRDIVNAGISSWTSRTAIVQGQEMYAPGNSEDLTAYAFELTQGYIVVSAYLGVENIILEWSDLATPIYAELDLQEDDKIVYAGGLNYFKEVDRDCLMDVDGSLVQKADVTDYLASAKLPQNVPFETLWVVAQSKAGNENQLLGAGDNYIDDPYSHASTYYGGTFVHNDSLNNWDTPANPLSFLLTNDFTNVDGVTYYGNCGPTAITNMLRMYGNKYSVSAITSKSNKELYKTVAQTGINGLFYVNSASENESIGGTADSTANTYVAACFDKYGVTITSGPVAKSLSYDNVKSSLRTFKFLYLMTSPGGKYKWHHFVGYGYYRLKKSGSNDSSAYKTYLKIADGHSRSPRFLDIQASVSYTTYWELK